LSHPFSDRRNSNDAYAKLVSDAALHAGALRRDRQRKIDVRGGQVIEADLRPSLLPGRRERADVEKECDPSGSLSNLRLAVPVNFVVSRAAR
jgi:hypothetical protein